MEYLTFRKEYQQTKSTAKLTDADNSARIMPQLVPRWVTRWDL